jgi:hypothetical protein
MKIIKVTDKHIKNGGCGRDNCPVALAFHDAGYVPVQVYSFVFTIQGVDLYPPRSVRRFVKRYDKLGRTSVKPFNFKLDI